MAGEPLPAGYRRVIREHVYDKCWSLDITWAEVEDLLDSGVVIERHQPCHGRVKEIRLLRGWLCPLHVVYAIDHEKGIIVFITVYEPDLEHWLPGFERRR